MGIEKFLEYSGNFTRGYMHGGLHGAYAPYLSTTFRRRKKNKSKMHRSASMLGFLSVSMFVHTPLVLYAAASGTAFAYFGALLATNVLDYIVRNR